MKKQTMHKYIFCSGTVTVTMLVVKQGGMHGILELVLVRLLQLGYLGKAGGWLGEAGRAIVVGNTKALQTGHTALDLGLL